MSKKRGTFAEVLGLIDVHIKRLSDAFESDFYEQEIRELRAAIAVLKACEVSEIRMSKTMSGKRRYFFGNYKRVEGIARKIFRARAVAAMRTP